MLLETCEWRASPTSAVQKKKVLQWGSYPAAITQRNLIALQTLATLTLYVRAEFVPKPVLGCSLI